PASVDFWFVNEMGPGLLLPNGKAFFLGGNGRTAIYTPTGNTNAGAWSAGADIPNACGSIDAPAAMMANGKILCAVTPLSAAHDKENVTTFYEYDYVSNTFTALMAPGGVSELNGNSDGTEMLDLPDGSVLFTDSSANVYVYRPDGVALAAGKPSISALS